MNLWRTNLGSRLFLIRVGLGLRVGRLSSLGLAVHSRLVLHLLIGLRVIGLGLGLGRFLLGGGLLGILLGGLLGSLLLRLRLALAGGRSRFLLGLRLLLRRGLRLGLLLALLGGLLLEGLLGSGGLDGDRLGGRDLLGNLGGLAHCEELGEWGWKRR